MIAADAPSSWNPLSADKYKWDAWTANKGLTQADAQQQYIDLVEKFKAE